MTRWSKLRKIPMVIVKIIGTLLMPFVWLARKFEEGSIFQQIIGIAFFGLIGWMGWDQTGVIGWLITIYGFAALLVGAIYACPKKLLQRLITHIEKMGDN